MSEPYKYPPSAVFPIPDSGNLNLVRKLDGGVSIANIESWSHFYDYSQDLNDGSGINHPFPSSGYTAGDGRYSKEWWLASGVINTYGSDARLDLVNEDESGIFSFDGVKGIADVMQHISGQLGHAGGACRFHQFTLGSGHFSDHSRASQSDHGVISEANETHEVRAFKGFGPGVTL